MCVDKKTPYASIQNNGEWDLIVDEPSISKLMNCEMDFAIHGKSPAITDLIENIDGIVVLLIDEDKKAAIIFALLDIIRRDEIIDNGKKESFKKCFGNYKQDLLHQEEFVFPDFIGRILFYTVYENVDNTSGKDSVGLITKDYINESADVYSHEYEWIPSTNTLSLTFVKIYSLFDKAVSGSIVSRLMYRADPLAILDDINRELCRCIF